MSFDMATYLEMRRKFLANRAAFPPEALVPYMGQWVAWSPDGSYVAASAKDPADLEAILLAKGLDPGWCILEGIPDDDVLLGELERSDT
jgi:hypothetical protein